MYISSLQSKGKRKTKAPSGEGTERVSIEDDDSTAKTPSPNYEWASYQQNVSPDYHQWDYLVADPQATHEGTYLDDLDDADQEGHSMPTLQIGRMILTERIGGLFRPHYAKEVLYFSPP